jgi:hypothetical protein
VATPVISPNGGNYSGSVSVAMQTATSGASIYYTTNGSTPTQSSTLYSGPMTLTSSATVKAKAFKSGSNPSADASVSFTVTQPFNFSLASSGDKSVTAGSSVTNSISTTLVSGSAQAVTFLASGLPTGATASFSSTSCSPACSSTLTINTSGSTSAGSSTITVTASGGGLTKTTTFSLNVSLQTVATPTISPNGGSYLSSVSVTMQTATPGASIYYTTNGSTPTQSSTLYTGAMTLTSNATVKAKAFKSGYTSSPEASASFTVSPSNLVAHWKFDEGSGTTATDASGNGNTGTLVNGPLWAAGRVGNALYFDGIDDNVTVPDSASLHLSSAFTLSAWVNPTVAQSDFTAAIAKNTATDHVYFLYATSGAGYCGSNGFPLAGANLSGTQQVICNSSGLPLNTWSYLTSTYDGSNFKFYVNGSLTQTVPFTGTIDPSTGILQIGASRFGEYFKGFIDEVRIYNRALSATEIQATYQQDSVATPQTVATPVISPNGGNYSGSVSVAMQTATSGASIYYTTNGSTPTQSSTLYTGAMTLTSSATVKAKAFKSGSNPSAEASASFTATPSNLVATTRTVSKTGADTGNCIATPCLTISYAITQMQNGDILDIRAGTYEERMTLWNASWVSSSYATGTVIQGHPGESVTLYPNGGEYVVSVNGPKYITIKNLRMNGGRIQCRTQVGLIASVAIGPVRFDGVELYNLGGDLGMQNFNTGQAGSFGGNVEFINGYVHDVGMNIGPVFNIKGVDHSVTNGGLGAYAFYWRGPNGVARNNRFERIGAMVFHIFHLGVNDTDDMIIEGNTILDSGGYSFSAIDQSVHDACNAGGNCLITGGKRYSGAVLLSSGRRFIVQNNLISNWTNGNAIYLGVQGNNDGSIIRFNTIRGVSPVAYGALGVADGATNIQVYGNIVVDNNGPNIFWDGRGSVTFTKNLCSTIGGTANCDGALTEASSATFSGTGPNPYSLKSGSKAINAVPTGCPPPSIDIIGTQRPQQASCDAGAYQFVETAPLF